MLSILLCTGRSSHDALDYPSYSLAEESPRKKPSFSSSRKGSKISKLQIGAPSDFRHESHMGYDEVAGFDIDEYQQRIQTRFVQQPQQQSPSPTSQSFSQNLNRSPSVSRLPVKRKPAPPTLPIDEISKNTPTIGNGSSAKRVSGSPTESKYARSSPPQSPARSTYSASQPPSLSISKKALVPLFGEPGGNSNAPYVTETAKIRYDGAMAEIERALKEAR